MSKENKQNPLSQEALRRYVDIDAPNLTVEEFLSTRRVSSPYLGTTHHRPQQSSVSKNRSPKNRENNTEKGFKDIMILFPQSIGF